MTTNVMTLAFGRELDPDDVKGAFSRANPGMLVQTFRRRGALNGFFTQMIAAQTLKAEASGCMLAKKPEMDFLLRIAGTTQISEALSKLGSKPGKPFMLVVASARPAKIRIPIETGEVQRKRTLSTTELLEVEKAALLGARRA